MRELEDRVYTVEVGGKAVLSFPATSFREAQSLLKERWLLDDLKEIKSGGVPLWDGKATLVVRIAAIEEIGRFQRDVKTLDGDDLPIVYHVVLY